MDPASTSGSDLTDLIVNSLPSEYVPAYSVRRSVRQNNNTRTSASASPVPSRRKRWLHGLQRHLIPYTIVYRNAAGPGSDGTTSSTGSDASSDNSVALGPGSLLGRGLNRFDRFSLNLMAFPFYKLKIRKIKHLWRDISLGISVPEFELMDAFRDLHRCLVQGPFGTRSSAFQTLCIVAAGFSIIDSTASPGVLHFQLAGELQLMFSCLEELRDLDPQFELLASRVIDILNPSSYSPLSPLRNMASLCVREILGSPVWMASEAEIKCSTVLRVLLARIVLLLSFLKYDVCHIPNLTVLAKYHLARSWEDELLMDWSHILIYSHFSTKEDWLGTIGVQQYLSRACEGLQANVRARGESMYLGTFQPDEEADRRMELALKTIIALIVWQLRKSTQDRVVSVQGDMGLSLVEVSLFFAWVHFSNGSTEQGEAETNTKDIRLMMLAFQALARTSGPRIEETIGTPLRLSWFPQPDDLLSLAGIIDGADLEMDLAAWVTKDLVKSTVMSLHQALIRVERLRVLELGSSGREE